MDFELDVFCKMWKYNFFYNFKRDKDKYGLKRALIIVFFMCILRGLSRHFIWKGNFWDGFSYPFIVFALASVILLPLYITNKKYPKVAKILSSILVIIGVTLIATLFIFILVLLLNKWLHFWF